MSGDQAQRSDLVGVGVVLVYFRTPERLTDCIESLRHQTLRVNEIVVVDNSSVADGTQERPAAGTDWRWLRSPANVGFGAACNAGFRSTTGDYILFVNPDVRLMPTACDALVRRLESNARLAVVGPRIYDATNSIELSARSFPSVWTGMLGRTSVVTRWLRRLRQSAPAGVSPALADRDARVDWVSGACMLVRRAAFEEVGGFDEGYWMYWEDADLCRRLASLGWQVHYEPDAVAHHATGSSGTSEATVRAFHDSAARYFSRHLVKRRGLSKLGRAVLQARCALILARSRRRKNADATASGSVTRR